MIYSFGSSGTEDIKYLKMITIPTHREPTHPGEMLLEEFLSSMGLTQKELANEIHIPYKHINEIINKEKKELQTIKPVKFKQDMIHF